MVAWDGQMHPMAYWTALGAGVDFDARLSGRATLDDASCYGVGALRHRLRWRSDDAPTIYEQSTSDPRANYEQRDQEVKIDAMS
uniref:MHC class I antigen n=1 Tax=Plectus sambesii TaxID=2011161 RepID=A0A914WFR0_9BILA